MWGCVASERTKHVIRWLEPLAPPLTSRKEKGLESNLSHWPMVTQLNPRRCDTKPPQKGPKDQAQEFLVWWTRGRFRGEGSTLRESMKLHTLPHTLHDPSSSVAVVLRLFFKKLLILAALGLCCCLGPFSGCSERGLLSTCSAWAPHCSGCCCRAQPQATGSNSCGCRLQESRLLALELRLSHRGTRA